jgi:hypothetical protein
MWRRLYVRFEHLYNNIIRHNIIRVGTTYTLDGPTRVQVSGGGSHDFVAANFKHPPPTAAAANPTPGTTVTATRNRSADATSWKSRRERVPPTYNITLSYYYSVMILYNIKSSDLRHY